MSYPIQATSILRPWVMELPIRHQGVLLAAVRGCDGMPKENNSKPITRAIRYAVLVPADEREVGRPRAFMQHDLTYDEIRAFVRDWDAYPIHFVQHLMHACQVIGYSHPDTKSMMEFRRAYTMMVDKLHLMPESKESMDLRLTEDRIALRDAGAEVD